MKDSYDFSNGVKNSYSPRLPKQQVTIRLDVATVQYFKEMAARSGISYQNIINLYLADCVKEKREIAVSFT